MQMLEFGGWAKGEFMYLGCSILNVMLHILFSKVFCKSKQWRNCFGDASAKVWMSSCYQWKCRRPVVSAFRCRTKILRKRLCSDTSEKVWMSSCYRFIVPCTYRCLVWSESFLVTLSSPNWKVWFQLQLRYATCVVVRLHMQVWCPDWQFCFYSQLWYVTCVTVRVRVSGNVDFVCLLKSHILICWFVLQMVLQNGVYRSAPGLYNSLRAS